MELKSGYKQTEVGVIPEDWSVVDYVSFGQVIDGDRGIHYPGADDLRDAGHCLFLNAGNVTRSGFRFADCQFISAEKDRKLNKGKLMRGDVVLTTRGTLGNFAYFSDEIPFEHIRINSGMVILRNMLPAVSNAYQYLVLRSRIVASQIERLSFGSAQPQLTVKGISTLKIPLPPTKAEQEAISEALSDTDALIESLEHLIAKKCQIKQGALQELLTGKKRLPRFETKPGYKQTEVGVIPKEWEVRPLVDIAEIRSGIAKNSNIAVSNPVLVHYLRVANVQDGFLDLSEMSKIRMNINDIKRYAVLPGDVLMNEGGDLDKLGRGSMWRGEFSPCVHQNHVFVVRCGSRLSPDYLNVWTGATPARRYFMLAGKQTTNLASINKTALGQLPVALPPRAEQEALATILSDIDAEIAALEKKLAKAHQLKQGMMQELLTGKIRLV
jgi:type I restriction enzyme S subunit